MNRTNWVINWLFICTASGLVWNHLRGKMNETSKIVRFLFLPFRILSPPIIECSNEWLHGSRRSLHRFLWLSYITMICTEFLLKILFLLICILDQFLNLFVTGFSSNVCESVCVCVVCPGWVQQWWLCSNV